MKFFKTYKEAVISNGSIKGVYKTGSKCGGHPNYRCCFRIEDPALLGNTTWVKCNPADYLESLESFLARGKRLVDYDIYTDITGTLVTVGKDVSAAIVNNKANNDDKLFVFQAAADQVETTEEKEVLDTIDTTPQKVKSLSGLEKPDKSEWKNGDSLVFGKDDRSGIYIAYDSYSEGHVVYSGGDYFYVLSGDFSKPESPAKREKRERLEAAYDLYCASVNAIALPVMPYNVFITSTFQVASMLAIVDKTGYRKKEV